MSAIGAVRCCNTWALAVLVGRVARIEERFGARES